MHRQRPLVQSLLAATVIAVGVASVAPARADQPGRGQTAAFEIDFLRFTIDHHFPAATAHSRRLRERHHARLRGNDRQGFAR
jgi:hypothetical protein